jgi:alpha-beta hydrolase superfamily lysophospholipase
MVRKRKSTLKKVLLSLVLMYLMLVTMLTVFQEKLIFLPTVLDANHVFTFEKPFQEVDIYAQDGARLNGIHFKVQNPKGVVLYFHGNSGDLQRWGQVAADFTKYNYDVVVMDYRGFGKSTGKRTEKKMYADAALYYEYVKQRYPEESIVLYGRSLGSTFATYIASKNNPSKLLLETPFYSLSSVAKKRFPIAPVKTVLRFHFPSHKYMQEVACPVFIIHGTDDNVVPYSSAKQLYEVIAHPQKAFYTIEGGGHKNLPTYNNYWEVMDNLF